MEKTPEAPATSHETTPTQQHSSTVNRRPSSGHKRSLSGRLLATLPFLRNASDDLPGTHDAELPAEDTAPKRAGAMAQAVRQSSGRRRKGSLRKTAILGTGRQRSSEHQRHASSSLMDSMVTSPTSPDTTTPASRPYTNSAATSSSESGWSAAASPVGTLLEHHTHHHHHQHHHHQTPRAASLASPIGSPITSPILNPYASTTSDDDSIGIPFPRPSAGAGGGPSHLTPNYFPLQASAASTTLQRRRSAKNAHAHAAGSGSTTRHSSPLSLPPATTALDLDEWDYSETEWWGWVVLVVTWIVFVIGMGSCLEVWSWAWDVGETPYAPPELEDDPTLPVVGYYPALMVLTAVMAWVWVVVAWVGMKYFRHAKFVGDES